MTESKVSGTSPFASGLPAPWLELGSVVALYGPVFGTATGAFRRPDSMGRSSLILMLGLGIVFLEGHVSLDDPLIQPLFWIAVGGILGGLRGHSTAARALDLQADTSTEDSQARLSAPSG